MKILDHRQITQKIKRLSIEILENNYSSKELVLIGLNNNGHRLAEMLHTGISQLTEIPITLAQLSINPAKPISEEMELSIPTTSLKSKTIILVDDVCNTGRSIFYACKPLMEIVPKKVEVAVMVDRKHKSFPIRVDYVGLSLATTLKENISVNLSNKNALEVLMD